MLLAYIPGRNHKKDHGHRDLKKKKKRAGGMVVQCV